jgi:hypothetical protein
VQTAGIGSAPPGISPPPIPNSTTANNTPPTDGRLSTRAEPSAPTVARHANYRPLPKKIAPVPVQNTKKRKHNAKSRQIQYFEDTESDDSDPGSGNGSSSGVSMPCSAPAKRQRTSRIATRSSARTSAPDVGVEDAPNPDALSPADDLLTGTPVTPTGSLQPANVPVGTTDVEPEITHDVPPAIDTDIRLTAGAGVEISPVTDTGIEVPPVTNTDIHLTARTNVEVFPVVNTNVRVPPITNTGVSATTTNPAVKAATSVHSITAVATSRSPRPPALSNDIDKSSVPSFLLSHGKGRREVNIFDYLNKFEDPHFRRVFLHYIRIEANDKSGVSGSLPTAKRPAEIGRWSAKARPSNLPEYAKGGRTFSSFVDSILTWWGSIQPSWRSFERGKVSREVRGDWDVLYAPRINGLLNVVILVYWWIGILEESEPEDGVRADYERFADDVAWVFSHITT